MPAQQRVIHSPETMLGASPAISRLLRMAAELAPSLPCQRPGQAARWASDDPDDQEAAAREEAPVPTPGAEQGDTYPHQSERMAG